MKSALLFFSLLLFSVTTSAAPSYRVATDTEASKLNGICRISLYGGMLKATGAWIKRPGTAADGSSKAWILGAGHTAIYNDDLGYWLYDKGSVPVGPKAKTLVLPEAVFRGITDLQNPNRLRKHFEVARVVFATRAPLDMALYELNATESELTAIGLHPLELASAAPNDREAISSFGFTDTATLYAAEGKVVRRETDFVSGINENAIFYYADMQSRAGMSGGPVLNRAGKIIGTVSGAGGTPLENDVDYRGQIQASADTFVSPASWLNEVFQPNGELDFKKFTAKIDEFRQDINGGFESKYCEKLFLKP